MQILADLPHRSAPYCGDFAVSEWRPGRGVSVAGLAGEVSLLEDGVGAGSECRDLAWAEIRLKVSEQARG